MIYLASPYSHQDKSIEAFRYDAACRAVATYMKMGYTIFSPIAGSHPVFMVDPEIGGNWEAWQKLDKDLIDASEELWVLMLEGWRESKGVNAEMEYAKSKSKPIKYVDREGNIYDPKGLTPHFSSATV
jgi:hypothetical protein